MNKTDRLILQEAAKIIRRARLSEMVDLSGIVDPLDRDERIRRDIIAGNVKDLSGKDLSDLVLDGAKLKKVKSGLR